MGGRKIDQGSDDSFVDLNEEWKGFPEDPYNTQHLSIGVNGVCTGCKKFVYGTRDACKDCIQLDGNM